MSLIRAVRRVINHLGIDLKPYPNLDLKRRKKLLDFYKISKILDVGANYDYGQYALETFQLNFKGTIISFEPVKSIFKVLEKNQKKSTLKSI